VPVTISDNAFIGAPGTVGASCGYAGRYSGNVFIGFATAADNCIDTGDNDVTP
jgi:hypothetical protein